MNYQQKQVIFYEINEALEDGTKRDNQYLKVYAFQSGEWTVIKEDQAEASSTDGDISIDLVEVITFTNDDREQLLVYKCARRCRSGNRYYVFGYDGGQYTDLEIPKGYLHSSDYLISGDKRMDLRSVKENLLGLVENYERQLGDIQKGLKEIKRQLKLSGARKERVIK